MPLIAPSTKVLVTGYTGIVGSPIALELLKAGFAVRGTSRSSDKAARWTAKHPDAALEPVIVGDQADLECYAEAIKGCEAVVHVAGPFTLDHATGQTIIDQQVNGIMGILQAAAKEPSIKRVVHISSFAAISRDPFITEPVLKDLVYTEKDWNLTKKGDRDPAAKYEEVSSYCDGKTWSEQAAWAFMDAAPRSFDLVVLCPTTAYGDPAHVLESYADLDTASERLWHHIENALTHTPWDLSPVYTNIWDTAESTLRALTWPSASGKRFLLASAPYSYARIFAILRSAFPEQAHRFPEIEGEGLPFKPKFTCDTAKAREELGCTAVRGLEETIIPLAAKLFEIEKREKEKAGILLQVAA